MLMFEKLIDIFQKLSESPEGIRKAIFYVFELGISLAISLFILKGHVTESKIEAFTDFQLENADQLLMKAILALAILVICWWVTAKVILGTPSFIIRVVSFLISKRYQAKQTLMDWEIANSLLGYFQVAKIESGLRATPLQNSDYFINIIDELLEIDVTERHEFLSNAVSEKSAGIVLGIGILYWSFLPSFDYQWYVTLFLILTIVMLILVATISRVFVSLVFKFAGELEGLAKYLRVKKWLLDECKIYNLYPMQNPPREADIAIQEDERTVLLAFGDPLMVLRKQRIKRIVKYSAEKEFETLLFVNEPPTDMALDFLRTIEHPPVTIVVANDIENIKKVFSLKFG